jgi:hypothetical protein
MAGCSTDDEVQEAVGCCPGDYTAMGCYPELKRKLDMYCAAVATAMVRATSLSLSPIRSVFFYLFHEATTPEIEYKDFF